MPFTRLMIGYGALFLGAVGIFMGLAISVNALNSGVMRYSHGEGKDTIVQSVRRADDAGGFWKSVALFGGAPMLVGFAGVMWGRRWLRS